MVTTISGKRRDYRRLGLVCLLGYLLRSEESEDKVSPGREGPDSKA